jgi:hypothetical protein
VSATGREGREGVLEYVGQAEWKRPKDYLGTDVEALVTLLLYCIRCLQIIGRRRQSPDSL